MKEMNSAEIGLVAGGLNFYPDTVDDGTGNQGTPIGYAPSGGAGIPGAPTNGTDPLVNPPPPPNEPLRPPQ